MAANHDQRRQVAAWLRPGKIVLLPFPDARNKPKYFIVAATQPDLLLIVINSERRRQNDLCVACQVGLRRDPDYPFLKKKEESYANGYAVANSISYDDAVQLLVDHPRWKMGQITETTRAELIEALSASDMITPVQLQAMLRSLA